MTNFGDLTAKDLPGAANSIKREAERIGVSILRTKLVSDQFGIEREKIESYVGKINSLAEPLMDRYESNIREAQHDLRTRVSRIRYVFPQKCDMREKMIKAAIETYRIDCALATTSYKHSQRLMIRVYATVARFDVDYADQYVRHA